MNPREARLSDGKVQAITFDVFGTLVRLDRPVERLTEALLQRGLRIPPETVQEAFIREMRYYGVHHLEGRTSSELLALRRRCSRVLFASLAEEGYSLKVSLDEMVEILMGAIRFQLYEDVLEVLNWCASKGLLTGIVSDWDCSLASTLGDLCPGHGFDCFLVSACEGITKSDSAIFLRAAAGLRLKPTHILHVGDDIEKDVQSPQRAGFQAILIDRSDMTQARGADGLLRIRGLPEIIGQWASFTGT